MRKIVAGLAVSLDGVTDSASGWMMSSPEVQEVIAQGTGRSDTILLGRKTYGEFEQLWPSLGDSFPMAAFMNSTPKVVVSSQVTSASWGDSTLVPRQDAVAYLTDLKSGTGGDILVPGSPNLVAWLLSVGLLDELGLMVHPLILGSGARFAETLTARFDLERTNIRPFDNGVISVSYAPVSA